MPFVFSGEISSSKSIYNRALVVQSFAERLEIHGLTQSEDVLHLEKALKQFKRGDNLFFCGEGGTTFRFLAVRVSRTPGEYSIEGQASLFARPMKPLLDFFDQVGVKYSVEGNILSIESEGWKVPSVVYCNSVESSQFLSAIILSSWNLETELNIERTRDMPSRGYLQMTLDLMKFCGAEIKHREATIKSEAMISIKSHQKPKFTTLSVEPDMSSLFTIAACAIMSGELEVRNIPLKSWQPDAIFFEHFRRMKLDYMLDNKTFFIRQQKDFKSIDVDLKHHPDLFPVLATLAGKAQGSSTFVGLNNLQYKESNRYKNTIDLLRRLDRKVDVLTDGIVVHGRRSNYIAQGDFDPHGDHRMAMAAQVANLGGAQLHILNKAVVSKSFPEFWDILSEVGE